MSQFVSARHKEIAIILRKEYGDSLTAWPDAEINVGHLAGIKSILNLRCDFFIWINDKCAVALEYHSEIHRDKVIFGSNIDAIKGRDAMKKGMLARLGIGMVEIWPEDAYDIDSLRKRIKKAAKEYPEITFTKEKKSSNIETVKKSNFNLEGKTKWQSRTFKSNNKLQSRPFKRS